MADLAELIIYESEASVIKELVRGYDLNEWDCYGLRPLIQAVICRKVKILAKLVKHGANIEQGDFLNRTALYWAADRNAFEMCYFLLKKGADPNHYSAEGQPILVNPILREQRELVELFLEFGVNYEFAQDFISAKLIGHRFELLGEADIVNSKGEFIPVSFEGFYLEFTSGLIQRSLYNFVNSIPGQQYSDIFKQLDEIRATLKKAAELSDYAKHKNKTPFLNAIENLLQSPLLLIPVGHKGHAITFIRYKNLFAKCDRGVRVNVDTVTIYQMQNANALNLDLFKKLLFEAKTDDFLHKELADILQLKYITSLSTNHQITGNCSWANMEASIPTMLLMLKLDVDNQNFSTIGDMRQEVEKFYRSWVEWDKETALDEAIEDFTATNSESRQLSKALILGSILVQRCDPKFSLDISFAKKILGILTLPNYRFILQNYIRVFILQNKNKFKDKLKRLLLKCELDLKTLTLKNDSTYYKANVHSENLVRMTTALHVAALNNNLAAMKVLIENHAIDVDYLDRTGSTPLMYAAFKGNLEAVKYLLKKGANPAIKNLKGGTARRYAAYTKHFKVEQLFAKYQ